MRSMFLFSFVVFVTVAGSALAENDSNPFFFRGEDCCSMVDPTEESFEEGIRGCMEKYIGNNTTGLSSRLSSEERVALPCAFECVASMEGLLTADHKLDKAAITKFFTPYDVAFGPAIYAAIEKCFDSSEADVDSSLRCKSGSHQFLKCFYRERFLNCPVSRWTASPACDELKANVTKCSKAPVLTNAVREKRSFKTESPKLRQISLDDFSVVKLTGNDNNWSKVLFPQLHQLSVDDLSVDNVQKWILIPVPQLPSLEDLGKFMYNVTNMLNIPVPQLPSLEYLGKFMDNVSKELNIPVPMKG